MLLYDEDCRVCRFLVRALLRADRERRLAVLPLGDPEAGPLLASLRPEERLASWRLARPDGSLVGEGAGIPSLLASLPRTRPLGRLLRAVPPGALDAGYRLAARNRGRLGPLVPDGPAPRRFP